MLPAENREQHLVTNAYRDKTIFKAVEVTVPVETLRLYAIKFQVTAILGDRG